jgi:hypothetical protein
MLVVGLVELTLEMLAQAVMAVAVRDGIVVQERLLVLRTQEEEEVVVAIQPLLLSLQLEQQVAPV